MRDEYRRFPLGCTMSSKNTPGERWSCDTMTRSAPLITKVPFSVMSGSSPRYTSCSMMSLSRRTPSTSSRVRRRSVAFSGAEKVRSRS